MLSRNVVLGWRAWARNRSLLSLLAATVVCCVLIGLTSEVMVAIPPFLTGRGVDVPNAAVVPLCVVIVQGWCLSRRDTRLEVGSGRRTALADCLLSMTSAVLLGTVAYVGDLPVGMVATRNIVGLSGVTLFANALGVKRLSALTCHYLGPHESCGGEHHESRSSVVLAGEGSHRCIVCSVLRDPLPSGDLYFAGEVSPCGVAVGDPLGRGQLAGMGRWGSSGVRG